MPRGESAIKIGREGDKDYQEIPIILNNWALAKAQKEMDKAIFEIIKVDEREKMDISAIGVYELAVFIKIGAEVARRELRLGGRTITMMDAYKIMDQVGVIGVLPTVVNALSEAIGVSSDDEDSVEESEADPNE